MFLTHGPTYQIICSTTSTLNVHYPDVFAELLEFLNWFALDLNGVFSLGCAELSIPTTLAYILVASCVPIIILVFI